ncbi:hypothetical protein SAMN02745215_00854 [Desulfitobacterium chlororespirans DSM 11544]|uniref:Uncharacterized protein n=2 Tax=Desulfitobacterium chlororespirans TaxID=51616 RepID=A0A1M7SHC8_9FIRM|nr:hypothetical protein SAMN02745215_00854 [Desulfitobacterium chlororespirans DSM 11544]
MKQVYAVIGDDCEIISTSFNANNLMNFRGTVSEAMAGSPEIQELAEQNALLANTKTKRYLLNPY